MSMWRWFAGFLGLLGLAAVTLGWTVSHFAPKRFGDCSEVPVSLGTAPTVRSCSAYSGTDFAIPAAVFLFLFVAAAGEDLEITFPGLGTIKRKAKEEKAEKAVSLLGNELTKEPTIDSRAASLFEGLTVTTEASEPDNAGKTS